MSLLLALALAGAGQLQKTTPAGSSFALICDGKPIGTFAQVTGLDVKSDMPDYRAGDAGNQRWFFPANTKYTSVDLQRGTLAAQPRMGVMGGPAAGPAGPPRFSECDITILSTTGAALVTWALRNPIAKKWEGPPGEVEIEFDHEGLMQKP